MMRRFSFNILRRAHLPQTSSIRMLTGSTKAAATKRQKQLLRLTIDPVPFTMADRLSALRVLQQYGTIQMFQRIENGLFHVIADEESTASTLLSSSPIVYATSSEGEVDSTCDTPSATDSTTNDSKRREIHMSIYPNYPEDVSSQINKHALAGSWPKEYRDQKTLSQQILDQSVPSGMAHEGLTYWGLDLINSGETGDARIRMKKMMPRNMLRTEDRNAIFGGKAEISTSQDTDSGRSAFGTITEDDLATYYSSRMAKPGKDK